MDLNFEFENRDAFVVSIEAVKRIHDILSDPIGKVTITAKCADRIERTFDHVDALSTYENSKSKRIVSLCISARSDDWGKEAESILRRMVFWWNSN